METTEWIALGQMLTGMLGVGLVWLGLQQMRRAGDQREKREDARHREAMTALDARHREAMTALDARHREAMTALDQQAETLRAVVKGMETIIERTGPRQ